MSIISLQDANLAYGEHLILNQQNFAIEAGQKIAIVGRNGQGKSTLLRILNNETLLDSGKVIYQDGLIVSFLQQSPPRNIIGDAFNYIASGNKPLWDLITECKILSSLDNLSNSQQQRYGQLIEQITDLDGWNFEERVLNLCKQYGFNPQHQVQKLSGGWLRKLELAKALIINPDVLLLDEPTNHLDLESIENLEIFINKLDIAVIFVSHDRSFIDNVAQQIVDLDRGKLTTYPGNFAKYVSLKNQALEVEEEQHQLFLKKLANEEIWLRQGVKARTTRSQFRVKRLQAMREEMKSYRKVHGSINYQKTIGFRSSKMIFDVDKLTYQYNQQPPIIKNFTTLIQAGDKIAIVGKNGIGKTTLINLLLNKLKPTSGTIKISPTIELAYFDQHRIELDPNKTLIDNLTAGKQELMVNGVQRNAIGYLQDFLFTPFKARSLVKTLSGGEKNRFLLAKLLAKPSNLLILDEPTNDLDLETLTLLEEIIFDYQGTVLIISHDRQFIDNTVTECLFFEDDGHIASYIGGYTDSLSQQQHSNRYQTRKKSLSDNHEKLFPKDNKQNYKETQQLFRNSQQKIELSFKEKRRLAELPDVLEQAESKLSDLQAKLLEPNFWSQDHQLIKQTNLEIKQLEEQINHLLEEWESLENKQKLST